MNRKKLLDSLKKAQEAISSNPIVDELKNVRIMDDVIRTTDGTTMIQIKLEEPTGVQCEVPANDLIKLLSGTQAEDVVISQDEERIKVSFSGEKTKSVCKYSPTKTDTHLLDTLDFSVDSWEDVSVPFMDGIRSCKFTVSKDRTRGPLCGVCLTHRHVVASDGFRISIQPLGKKESPIAEGADRAVLDGAFASIISGYETEEIKGFAIKDQTAYFKIGTAGNIIAAKLLSGQYPDFLQFLEKAKGLKQSIKMPKSIRDSLKRHLEQQADLSDLDKEVTISISKETISVSSTNGVSYEMKDDIDFAGGEGIESPVSFKIHPGFILDLLNRTLSMKYDEASNFAAFEDGKLIYLTTIDR